MDKLTREQVIAISIEKFGREPEHLDAVMEFLDLWYDAESITTEHINDDGSITYRHYKAVQLMTKSERIELIAVCAKLEATADSLNRAYELSDNPFIKNIIFEQISSLHDAIGEILNIGKKEL